MNKTNLKGVNGLAKARIEVSHKKKKDGKYDEKDYNEEYENVMDDKSVGSIEHKTYKNVCFICHLPGHFAKDCILTKEMCYECGERVNYK